MTVDVAKKWIIHFQNRIILQKLPNPLYTFYLDLLLRFSCGKTCDDVNERICEVVNYLKHNLPQLCKPNTLVNTDVFLTDCKFYQLRVTIIYGKAQLILGEESLIFKNKKYYLNITNLIQTNLAEEFWYIPLQLRIEVKLDLNSEWVDLFSLQNVQIL